MLRVASGITAPMITLSLALLLAQAALSGARLSKMVALLDHHLPLSAAFRVTLESCFFNQAFISFLGGDALRIWRVRQSGLPLADATGAVALDRLTGVAINHFTLILALPLLLSQLQAGTIRTSILVIAAGGTAALAGLLFFGYLLGRVGLADSFPHAFRNRRVVNFALEIATVSRHMFGRGRSRGVDVFWICVITLLIAGVNGLVFFVILHSWGIDTATATACALLVPAVMEIALLPISIAGWGLREGAAVLAFGALQLDSHVALAASILFGFLGLAVSLIGGVLWILDRLIDPKRVLQDATQPE